MFSRTLLFSTLLVARTGAEVYTIDWQAAKGDATTERCNSGKADANQCNRFTNGGIGDTFEFTNVGSHDVTYFICPGGVSEGSLGNDPNTGWACPTDVTDTQVFTKLEVVEGTATFTVDEKFGGGTKNPTTNNWTPGLCFFCSIGTHCNEGMKLTAVADNGPKCSVAYLIATMGDSLVSGEALEINPTHHFATQSPDAWKAGGGSQSAPIVDASGADCGKYNCGKSGEAWTDATAGEWVYSSMGKGCAVDNSILGGPAGGDGGGGGDGDGNKPGGPGKNVDSAGMLGTGSTGAAAVVSLAAAALALL